MAIDRVFAALSDSTRLQLLEWLTLEGSGTATGFAKRLSMTRQGVSRHLLELERAGIVSSQRVGRETIYKAELRPIGEAASWLEQRSRSWDRALERLRSHVEE